MSMVKSSTESRGFQLDYVRGIAVPEGRFRFIPLSGRKDAVAGFFEDLPALMVVVIGVTIFLASMINAFMNYSVRQYENDPQDGQKLLEAIVSYPGLIKDGYKDGTFDRAKLRDLTIDDFERDIFTDFDYEIYIEDVSDYPDRENYNFNTSKVSDIGEDVEFRLRITYPVNIYTSIDSNQRQTCIHGAFLRITLWK
ncbi:MAG: hypothetical protein QGH39_00115 [Candidatus Thermoplasmatota archaeon]|nr:hypothetical protein [Candidatus Thermoplasmatota archaeon]